MKKNFLTIEYLLLIFKYEGFNNMYKLNKKKKFKFNKKIYRYYKYLIKQSFFLKIFSPKNTKFTLIN